MLDKLYYVNVGPHGTFNPSGNSAFDSTPGDIDKIFTHLNEKKTKNIVIYAHGGLVKDTSGMQTAARIKDYITTKTNAHPISLVWETDFIGTIQQNLSSIKSTRFFQKLLIKITKIAGKKLGIDIPTAGLTRGVGGLSDEQIETELNKEAPFDNYTVNVTNRSVTISGESIPAETENQIAAELEEEIATDHELQTIVATKSPQELPLLNIDKIRDQDRPGMRGFMGWGKLIAAAVKITITVIKRHLQKRDHGFYPTIIEEIMRELYLADFGAWVWGDMKQKALEMWIEDDPGVAELDMHAGNYLLTKLKEYSSKNEDVVVDVVGHSAGAIVICGLFQQLTKRNIDIRTRNIVFMAPACRSELFADAIITNSSRFKTFRMFTMKDELEIKDRLLSFVYPRSLLYFISGVLEDKGTSCDAFILGLERFQKGNAPYSDFQLLNGIDKYLTSVGNQVVLSQTATGAANGLQTMAIHHGDFDNDGEVTLDSIIYIINS